MHASIPRCEWKKLTDDFYHNISEMNGLNFTSVNIMTKQKNFSICRYK